MTIEYGPGDSFTDRGGRTWEIQEGQATDSYVWRQGGPVTTVCRVPTAADAAACEGRQQLLKYVIASPVQVAVANIAPSRTYLAQRVTDHQQVVADCTAQKVTLEQELTDEQAKPDPDPVKIAELQQSITTLEEWILAAQSDETIEQARLDCLVAHGLDMILLDELDAMVAEDAAT